MEKQFNFEAIDIELDPENADSGELFAEEIDESEYGAKNKRMPNLIRKLSPT